MNMVQQVTNIREATSEDFDFVANLMTQALSPYYGGDHKAHVKRILTAHLDGRDRVGFFSFEQKMFILLVDGQRAGVLHLVGKRQGTYKISPIVLAREYRNRRGLGTMLLQFAENYAKSQSTRQMYCTVAEQNEPALMFFRRNDYIVAGKAENHYKPGSAEIILYKELTSDEIDKPNISVLPCSEMHESQVRQLLLDTLPKHFEVVDTNWVNGLFAGYERRHTHDINLKYKIINVAVDRNNTVLGIAGATPKKGDPIKVMPLVATTLPAFNALLADIAHLLRPFGRKLYVHLVPSVEETIILQRQGWVLEAVLPAAYHPHHVTQQWGLDVSGEDFMRTMRIKQYYLDKIKGGQKTLEVRVGYDSIKTIKTGDRIRLMSRTEIIVQVKEVRQYKTFADMLEHEEASKIVPGMTKPETLKLLQEIYPPEREKLGVIVLELQVENKPTPQQV